jgi:DNA-binding PadR family transcriptional regulator
MDETAFRILDALSRDPGGGTSISALSRDIKRLHGTAYYSNIYNALHRLEKDGIVELTKARHSSLVSLNLRNRQTIDALSEMELQSRRSLLAKRQEIQRLFDALSETPSMGPASFIDAERNMKLNRAELLIQVPEGMSSTSTEALGARLDELEGKLNIRIDALILDEKEFRSLLAAPDKNVLKEMLCRRTALFAPDLFWSRIRNAWAHGIRIQFEQEETNPANMTERDLIYNLARFGYSEFGSLPKEGQDIGIEYVVAAVLLKGDARRIQAIPVILAKNQANYGVLLFLAKKYGVQGQLYGLLRVLAKHDENQDLQHALRMAETARVKEVLANEAGIEEMMRTYHAIPRS